MYFKEVVWVNVDWIDLALDWGQWWALVNMVMNFMMNDCS
jgi:hypothetical protein